MLQELRQHPEVFREAFVEAHGKQEALTAETVEKLFTVNWSEEGSDRFRREKKVISHWADFLQDLGTFFQIWYLDILSSQCYIKRLGLIIGFLWGFCVPIQR